MPVKMKTIIFLRADFSPFHFSHKILQKANNCILNYLVLLAGVNNKV